MNDTSNETNTVSNVKKSPVLPISITKHFKEAHAFNVEQFIKLVSLGMVTYAILYFIDIMIINENDFTNNLANSTAALAILIVNLPLYIFESVRLKGSVKQYPDIKQNKWYKFITGFFLAGLFLTTLIYAVVAVDRILSKLIDPTFSDDLFWKRTIVAFITIGVLKLIFYSEYKQLPRIKGSK